MNKIEAWLITLVLAAVMAAISTSIYRWALALIVVPVGFALLLIFL